MSADAPTPNRTSRRDRRPEDRSTFTVREKLDWSYSVPLTAGRGVSLGAMRHVLGALAWKWSDGFGGSCYPSTDTIAELLGLSPDQVQRALVELDRQGVLVRHRRHRERGRLATYDYRLMLTRPHHADRSDTSPDDRPDRTMRTGQDESRPHDATDQTAPCGESRPHHAVAEQSIENNPPNRHRTEITHENIAHRAGEIALDDKLARGDDVPHPDGYVRAVAKRLVAEKPDELDRLVGRPTGSLDDLAYELLHDRPRPPAPPVPPQPTLYTPPPDERCTPEQARAALDRARRDGHQDEAGSHRDEPDEIPPAGPT